MTIYIKYDITGGQRFSTTQWGQTDEAR